MLLIFQGEQWVSSPDSRLLLPVLELSTNIGFRLGPHSELFPAIPTKILYLLQLMNLEGLKGVPVGGADV